MAEKKYKGRRAYLNDFKKNEQGNYEYQGDLYYWKGEKESLKKEMMILWLIGIGMLAALVLAGCVDAPGAMNSFSVVLPYTISFVFGISTVWGLWRLFEGGNPLRAYVYKASVEQIPIRCMGTVVCAMAVLVGEIIFLIRHFGEENPGKALLFLLLEGVGMVFAIVLRKRAIKMVWEKKSKIDK